jgi:predicted Ser/Thr protein kinase
MHPSEDDLRRYLDEGLGEANRAAVEAHLQDCPRCLEALQAMGEEAVGDLAEALRRRPLIPPRLRPPAPDPEPARQAGINLLFGVLALQNHFIGPDDLLGAFAAWVADTARPLGRILVDQGVLADDAHALVEAMVAEHLKQHGGDPETSLGAASSLGSVRSDQERSTDPDRRASSTDRTADAPRTIAEGPGVHTGPYEPLPPEPILVHPTEDSTCAGATLHYGPAATEATAGRTLADSQTDDLSSGARVRYFGDYEVRGELGHGAMGVVYRARQLSLNRPVALKMIRAGVLAGSVELRRFQNEAEAVAQLDHPGIIPIHEVGEHAGQRYFSMKLVEGGSLVDRLADFKDRPQAAARLVAEAAEAVHHAHVRGILHRDLKPANILVDDRGRPHITDFGLARRLGGDSELTQSGAVLGTPAYMSPEQAAGRHGAVTIAGDVYGLGAVLYALLTGRAPFGGNSVEDTLRQVRERAPERPSKFSPRTPRDLEVIVLKCLEKDPRRRYGSAAALAEDLRRYVAGEPITARPVGAMQRVWMWCRRNKGIAALGTLLVASLIAGTAFSLAFAFRARDQSRRANAAAGLAGKEAIRAAQQADAAQRQRDWSERLRYIAEVNLAQRDWDAGNAELARGRLADLAPKQPGDPDVRGWEWFRLDAVFQPELRVLRGHGLRVLSVAFAPDGRTLASAGLDRTVRLWDTASGRETVTLRGHRGTVFSVAFAPDGKALASAGDDGVRLWDTASGRETAMLRGQSVVFAPDGRTLASAGEDGTVRLWDVALGRETATLRGQRGTAVVFAPDGRALASAGGGGTVQLWDAAPLTPERQAHREALGFVRFLLERVASPADLRDRIRRDPTVSEEVRARALELANGHWEAHVRHQNEKQAKDLVTALFADDHLSDEVEEAVRARTGLDPEVRALALELAWSHFGVRRVNDASWAVAREPGRDPAAYRLALRRAKAVCGQMPHSGPIVNTLGVAQYRVGLYREALATLTRSNTLNGGRIPADLAFLAMAQQRLGQVEAARQTLTHLRAAMKVPAPNRNAEDDAAFLCEAEALIELDPAFPADPFAP